MTDADRRQLAAVTPAQLTAYLAAHGWHQAAIAHSGATLWRHSPAAGDMVGEVLVPHRTDYADYVARVWDVLHTVALVERRPGPEWAVLADMEESAP